MNSRLEAKAQDVTIYLFCLPRPIKMVFCNLKTISARVLRRSFTADSSGHSLWPHYPSPVRDGTYPRPSNRRGDGRLLIFSDTSLFYSEKCPIYMGLRPCILRHYSVGSTLGSSLNLRLQRILPGYHDSSQATTIPSRLHSLMVA